MVEIRTELINLHISNPEQHLKVFDKSSVYLLAKKIGKNNPKTVEIEADNAAAKILEVNRTEIHEKVCRFIKNGRFSNLFRSIVGRAKEFIKNLIY